MATLTTLVTFSGTDGSEPYSGLAIDADGNLFGTTLLGGASGLGTVFEVVYDGSSYASTPTTLVSFDGTNGSLPYNGNLLLDADRNLFGTTLNGGSGYGNVFEIAHLGGGIYASTPTTLVDFNNADGASPQAGLIFDAAGNLLGTTYQGGAGGQGTVFRIDSTGGGSYASTPTTLATFTGPNGQQPQSALTTDADGNLFGTTFYGGDFGDGTVYKLANNGDGSYTQTILVSFDLDSTTDGANPYSGVILDAAGNLFGTTYVGGTTDQGTVFELVNNGGISYTFNTLVSFSGADGANPYLGNLIIDAAGNLFGTTVGGGASGAGTVFEVVYDGSSYASTPTVLASFDGISSGVGPLAGIVADASGNLFGVTNFTSSGNNGDGTVWELTGSGFVVACYLRGTRIATPMGEVPVEELAVGDRVVTFAGPAKPIRWIGRRAYDGRFVAGNRAVLPIRFAAGAFADGVPARDLWVSPEHALYIDGVLAPASTLVNGATITQAGEVERIEYFHIELDEHDIIFAEGAPAETYVDCDNRFMFHNAGEFAALYPRDERPAWQFCAPRIEAGAAELTAIRAALWARAEALGHALNDDPDLHLIVDGQSVRPHTAGSVYRFAIPAGSVAVWLASRSAVPAEIEAAGGDIRRLGVPVERIVLHDGDLSIEAWHGHSSLCEGFHEDEAGHRWTDGMARLPETWVRSFPGAFTLEMHLVPSELGYRLPLPARTAAA